MNAELDALDLAVAKAEGIHLHPDSLQVIGGATYHPTRDGAEAMRLLEKYRIDLCFVQNEKWIAFPDRGNDMLPHDGEGSTPAIAICRAVVAVKP